MNVNMKSSRNRNNALLLIAAGVFVLLQKIFGFYIIITIGLIVLGIYYLRNRSVIRACLLLSAGLLLLLIKNVMIVVAVIIISIGYFILKSKRIDANYSDIQKHKLIESVRLGKEPWVLRSSSTWSAVGEIQMDLSMAIFEEKETTLILHGIVGDLDFIIPDEVGVSIESSIIFGQINANSHKEAGIMNKILWCTPNYENSDNKLNLRIVYVVGDIDIKIV